MTDDTLRSHVRSAAGRVKSKARGKIIKPTIEQLKAMHLLLRGIDLPQPPPPSSTPPPAPAVSSPK